MSSNNRKQVSEEAIDLALAEVKKFLVKRLAEKGYGTFASRHEILGVVTAEYHELVEAVEHKEEVDVRWELMDVAVGCVFGWACMKQETTDW